MEISLLKMKLNKNKLFIVAYIKLHLEDNKYALIHRTTND